MPDRAAVPPGMRPLPGQSTYGPPEYMKLYSESTPTELLGCPTAVWLLD